MPDPRTDQIAREAARLMETGRADSVDRAIHMAIDALGSRGSPLPSHGRVRKHAQAMSMQALGDVGYEKRRLHVWGVAEQIMAAFELAMPAAEMLLVGRAAKGHFDAGVTLHFRLYTESPLNEIADVLENHGYGAYSFQTVDTRAGRLNQSCFEDDGQPVVITRCPPLMHVSRTEDLFTGERIAFLELAALRWQLESRSDHK